MEKVVDRVMYHFHKPYVENGKWKEGNEIIVDSNYNAYFIHECLYGNEIGIPNGNGDICSYINAVHSVIRNATDEEMLLLAKNKEEYLEKINYVKSLLTKSISIAHKAAIYNREMGLEDYRLEHCPELPSRLHSMWVCDPEQVGYWKTMLDYECELYLLSLTGNLFRATGEFLPAGYYDRKTVKDYADKYWNPPVDRNETKDEYLFQGKAKILKRIFI